MEGISVAEMRELDASAIAKGKTVPQLMENAGKECARLIEERFGTGNNVLVFCGPGNNGGDGSVCARYLHPSNSVKICLPTEPKTPAAVENFVCAKERGIEIIQMEKAGSLLNNTQIVVDALLGVGSTLPLRGKIKDACILINSVLSRPNPPRIISIDVPTGMDADTGETDRDAIPPYATICIHAPKTGEVKAGREKTGELWVADIGLGT